MGSFSRQMRLSSALLKRLQSRRGGVAAVNVSGSRSFSTTEGHRPTIIHKRNLDILHSKGTAFSMAERDCLDLLGPLPPNVMTPEQQIERFRNGHIGYCNQANNVFLFPWIGLGTLLSRSKIVSDRMLQAAAECLAEYVTEEELFKGIIYPSISSRISDVTTEVVAIVIQEAMEVDLWASKPSSMLAFTAMLVSEAALASQTTTHAVLDPLMTLRFEKWIVRNGRVYKNIKEKAMRFNIFRENVEYIESVNRAGDRPYKLGVNKFADLTNKEFATTYASGSRRRPGLGFSFRYASEWPSIQCGVKGQGRCYSR